MRINMSCGLHVDNIFAVETVEELSEYQFFARRCEVKLRRYIDILVEKYAVEDIPETIV